MNWKYSAGTVAWNIQPFIGGHYRQSKSREFFDNVNPATETSLCRVPVGSAADVDDAVRTARRRFTDGSWSGLRASRRAELLLRLAELMERHKERLALLYSLEMGKPIHFALLDAGTLAPDFLRTCAEFADKLLGSTAPVDARRFAFNCYEPRGVIGAITPWNFPSLNAVIKFGPALAAGNTVVLKPSELSSASALKLAELALEAGFPEGVLNVVPGLGATSGAALAMHADVNLVSFTGSTVTGRKIMELSGRSNGKPVLLECGGKSPQVVFNDVENLDVVAQEVVSSALWNQSQVCTAHTRLLAHSRIKPQLLERVVALARAYRPDDPLNVNTTFGPLASPAQRERVRTFIEQAIDAGAEPVLKGNIQMSGGCYVAPTIFDHVDNSMSVVREEIFGPVLCVQQFDSDEEAISLANATDYGLAATVWTRDMGRAKRMAHAINAGGITIRTSGEESADPGSILGYEPQKASGFGCEFGLRGLQAYSTLKSITLNGS